MSDKIQVVERFVKLADMVLMMVLWLIRHSRNTTGCERRQEQGRGRPAATQTVYYAAAKAAGDVGLTDYVVTPVDGCSARV